MICSVDGCDKQAHSRGLCHACYARQRRKSGTTPCSISGCGLPAVGKTGMCSKCYQTARRNQNKKTLPDLPEELWADIEGHPGWRISTLGRVKSLRGHHERLIIPRIFNGRMFVEDHSRGGFAVHLQVLRTFHPEATGDPVFIDGNILNARLDNLKWDTRADRLNRAIAMAEASESPWGDAFAAYWRGDNHALDAFWQEMQLKIIKAIHYKILPWVWGYHLNVEEVAHITLVRTFFAIHAASLSSLDNLTAYMLTVADRILAGHWRYAAPLSSIIIAGNDGTEGCLVDATGYCNPSAELEAIWRETSQSM